MDRFVCYLNFALKLPETRVKPEKHVDRKQPPAECNLRVSEDRSCLIIEGTVAILTEIPLVLSIAAVFDHRFRPAARATEALAAFASELSSSNGNIAFG